MSARLRKILLAAIVCASTPLLTFAQDADKVLDAAVKARGSGKLRKVSPSAGRFSHRQSDSRTGTYTLNLKSPNRYYAEFTFGGQLKSSPTTANLPGAKSPPAKSELAWPEALELEAAAQLYNSISWIGKEQDRRRSRCHI